MVILRMEKYLRKTKVIAMKRDGKTFRLSVTTVIIILEEDTDKYGHSAR